MQRLRPKGKKKCYYVDIKKDKDSKMLNGCRKSLRLIRATMRVGKGEWQDYSWLKNKYLFLDVKTKRGKMVNASGYKVNERFFCF